MYYQEHKFKSFDGTRLYVRESGTGPLLVLIHGGATDADFYKDTAEVLSQWFHVISYDRRGYVRSGCPRSFWRHLDANAKDVVALIDAFSDDGTAYVVGHSLGGYVAMRTAQRFPEKIKKLLLHEPAFQPLFGYLNNKGLPLLLFKDPEATKEPTEEETKNVLPDAIASILFDGWALLTYLVPLEALEQLDVTIALGRSSEGTAIYNETLKLARQLGTIPMFFRGAHNGGYFYPEDFALKVKSIFLEGFDH